MLVFWLKYAQPVGSAQQDYNALITSQLYVMPIEKEVECSTLDLSTTTLLTYVYFYSWRESLML